MPRGAGANLAPCSVGVAIATLAFYHDPYVMRLDQ
jgi:hypothetical protein